jgi:hypothetical protein
MILHDFYNALLTVGIPVSHYEGELDEYPYIVYSEYSTSFKTASGKPYEEKTRVEIIHYTKTEFDPSLESLKKMLLDNNIIFSVATTFDPESKVIQSQIEAVISRRIGG